MNWKYWTGIAALVLSIGCAPREKTIEVKVNPQPTNHKPIAYATVHAESYKSEHFRIIEYETSILEVKGRVDVWYSAGLLHYEHKEWNSAMSHFTKVLDESPTYVPAMHMMGRCLAKVQRFDEATAYIKKALKFDPDNEEYQKSKQWILERQQWYHKQKQRDNRIFEQHMTKEAA